MKKILGLLVVLSVAQTAPVSMPSFKDAFTSVGTKVTNGGAALKKGAVATFEKTEKMGKDNFWKTLAAAVVLTLVVEKAVTYYMAADDNEAEEELV